MSWQDRPYGDSEFGRPEMRLSLPRPTSAVGWLLAINIGVFFLTVLSQHISERFVYQHFGLSLVGIASLKIWQPLSYMFLHHGVMHLVFNMLGLYIFGSEFERSFGRRRFLQFYFFCGLVSGLAYLLWSLAAPSFSAKEVVGASGAIYGLLIAAIIFFPHMQIVLIIFPVPVRVFGLILGAILLLQLISPGRMENPGGEVCHLAGAAAGIGLFHVWGMMPRVRLGNSDTPERPGVWGRIRNRRGAWKKRQHNLATEQAEVDRILDKVHQSGLNSLTRSERKMLAAATRRQREHDRQIGVD